MITLVKGTISLVSLSVKNAYVLADEESVTLGLEVSVVARVLLRVVLEDEARLATRVVRPATAGCTPCVDDTVEFANG